MLFSQNVLYALVTEDECAGDWHEVVKKMLQGGVDVIQLREKNLPDNEFLSRARWLSKITARFNSLSIINDRPDIAILAGADGVHLGQDDLPVREVKQWVDSKLLIGQSTHSVIQAEKAESEGVDYIGAGPVFPTATKGYSEGKGLELVARIVAATSVPVIAIGGIDLDNVSEVMQRKPRGIAVCSALCGVEDPSNVARNLKHDMRESCRG